MEPLPAATVELRPPGTAESTKRPNTTSTRPSTGFNASGTLSLGGTLRSARGPAPKAQALEFTSDVGRKKFGFSHEELDGATAYYEGQFKLYQRFGEGTLHNLETGAKYVGQFQNDRCHGYGDQVWSDGSRYRGQWRDGQKHGSGEYISPEELRYAGQWENGRKHGQGKQEYANNDRYSGGWFRGLCSGVGTYHFADGSRYEGVWAQGRYDGQGVLYGSDGSRERQWYTTGVLVRREVLPDGPPPKPGSKRDMIGGKVVFAQSRLEMQKPAMLPKPQTSVHLIRRETQGRDLSAPPLKPRAAPASLQHAVDLDLTPRPPATAPSRPQDQ